MILFVLFSCKNDELYRDNKALACRPNQAGDGNRCERWGWKNGQLLDWKIIDGGGCDVADTVTIYKFDYDENGVLRGFSMSGAMADTGRFDYDDAGRPSSVSNALGESVQWLYEGERIRRAVYLLQDTSYEIEYDHDAYGNVVRSGAETYTYDVRVKNMYSHLPLAALLWVKGPEYASPHQRLIRRDATGAESGYKAAVANAQGYPVRLPTLDAGLVTVSYECK